MSEIKQSTTQVNNSNQQSFVVRKGGNKKTQLELENPSTVAMTDTKKVDSNVKEKRSNTVKN